MTPAEGRGGQLAVRARDQLPERIGLARPERPPRRTISTGQGPGDGAAGVDQPDPALVAWPGTGARQHPFKRDVAAVRQCAQPPQEAGTAVRSGEVADRSRAALELSQEIPGRGVGRHRRSIRIAPAGRRDLRDELEPLQQAGRQHGPEHEGRRREVMRGDPAGQGEPERRQQRPIRPDAIDDRPGHGAARRPVGLGDDDPQRLAASEVDEHRFARLRGRPAASGTAYV